MTIVMFDIVCGVAVSRRRLELTSTNYHTSNININGDMAVPAPS